MSVLGSIRLEHPVSSVDGMDFTTSVIALAAVVLVIHRQTKARPAAILIAFGLFTGGVIDPAQPALSVVLLVRRARGRRAIRRRPGRHRTDLA